MYHHPGKFNNRYSSNRHPPTCSCDECARLEGKFMQEAKTTCFRQIEKFKKIEDILTDILNTSQYPHDLRLMHSAVSLRKELEKESEIAGEKLKHLELMKNQNRPFKTHQAAHSDRFNQSFERSVRTPRERPPSPANNKFIRGLTVWGNKN